jgi:8-oxo-dGTP pyrophosphatase MutT (NUDIX family)
VEHLEDVSFRVGSYRFNYRIAAIIEHNGRYLLSTVSGLGFWFLSGGRVKAGESSLDAMGRELREELGIDIPVMQLVWTVENFFTLDGEDFHEVSFYFKVSLPQNTGLVGEESFVRDPGLAFRWFDLEAIQAIDLRPRFLKSKLSLANQGFRHIVFRDVA